MRAHDWRTVHGGSLDMTGGDPAYRPFTRQECRVCWTPRERSSLGVCPGVPIYDTRPPTTPEGVVLLRERRERA